MNLRRILKNSSDESEFFCNAEAYFGRRNPRYIFRYFPEKDCLGIREKDRGGEDFAVRNIFRSVYEFFDYINRHILNEPMLLMDESQEFVILDGVECKVAKFYEGEESTMNDNEVIEYLKGNREKGVCYRFMPDEVKEWVLKAENRRHCMILDSDGEWDILRDASVDYAFGEIGADSVWCLPQDFSVKKGDKSGWVEFDIDEKGYFHIDHGEGCRNHVCHYTEWNKMLIHYADNGYINFGGFQYEGLDTWFMSHNVKYGGGGHAEWYRDRDSDNVFPETPVKIRFWKEAK